MLTVDRVTKRYRTPRGELSILTDISLSLERGAAIAIMGPSGSGKSTLLYILGALEAPSSGTVTLDGKDPYRMGEREQAAFRNQQIGFVFQDHSLLPQCSVLENVLAPTFVAPPADAGPRRRHPGAGAADPGRTRRPARPSSRRAVGRRKTTGRARARAHSQSDTAALRRTDRQPRSCRGRHGGRSAARAACGPQHDPGGGDP